MKKSCLDYRELGRLVHESWDPLGVWSFSQSTGEYEAYLPKLWNLLQACAEEEEIFRYLWAVETDAMGLSGQEGRTRAFANRLVEESTTVGCHCSER